MVKLFFSFFLTFFISVRLFADYSFLSSLPFGSDVYPDEVVLTSVKDNGIDYKLFEQYLLDPTIELGKKVGLLSELESYFIWSEGTKPYFNEYTEQFKKTVERKYADEVPITERYLLALMNDYETYFPNVEAYRVFVEENPESRAMQSILVIAFNFKVLQDQETQNYASLDHFKEKYQDYFFQNFENFTDDVPITILPQIERISALGFDCNYDLNCLAPADNMLNVIHQKTEDLLNKAMRAEPIPRMAKLKNAEQIGLSAYGWLVNELQLIANLNISDGEKALLEYFIANETYNYVNNVDNLAVYYNAVQKTPEEFLQENLRKQIEALAPENDWQITDQLYEDLKNDFEQDNGSFLDFGGGIDDLRNLIYYFHLHPQEITKIYKQY